MIIPAYNSHSTVIGCLQAIDTQAYRDFDVVVVDSSPGDETERMVAQQFPSVRLIRSETRLYPHAARNRGVAEARGELLAFTDSDIYPTADWLGRLVEAHASHGAVVVGAITCYGSNVFDRGVHLCKFAKWLPYGVRRFVDMSPTGNMLLHRDHFALVGGFARETYLGDVTFSRDLRAAGVPLIFEPQAMVEHHHDHTLRSFLKERFERGILFGEMRSQWLDNRALILFYLLATVIPVRMIRIAAIIARQIARAHPHRWVLSYPVALLGHAASLAGESLGYARVLTGHATSSGR